MSVHCCISYRKQSFDLQCKSNDQLLYKMQQWAEMVLTLSCSANQWTGFSMITSSVMKELKKKFSAEYLESLKQRKRLVRKWWKRLNPLNANPTKWSSTLKQFVEFTQNRAIKDHHPFSRYATSSEKLTP